MPSLNHNDPSQPPWVLILADGQECHFQGYGTNSNVFPYYCRGTVGATLPDRSQPTWTVREGTDSAPSSIRVAVVTAYR
jgi:hypothetical protein